MALGDGEKAFQTGMGNRKKGNEEKCKKGEGQNR